MGAVDYRDRRSEDPADTEEMKTKIDENINDECNKSYDKESPDKEATDKVTDTKYKYSDTEKETIQCKQEFKKVRNYAEVDKHVKEANKHCVSAKENKVQIADDEVVTKDFIHIKEEEKINLDTDIGGHNKKVSGNCIRAKSQSIKTKNY